jgi:PAS domain S-box-containing protein
MLKFATELIMVIDTDNRITELNDNFLKFYSVDREDLLQKRISELNTPPFDTPEMESLLLDVQRLEEPTKEIRFDFKGQAFNFRFKIIPMVFEDGGRGFTFIIEDNTREKMIEERLRINEERIRAIVNTQTE